jgi:hypothetical protein
VDKAKIVVRTVEDFIEVRSRDEEGKEEEEKGRVHRVLSPSSTSAV